MELRQLRYFIKAAETLNFSEAAKALFITQSTFSQQIKQLEEDLKITLFHRNSHDVSLTEAGHELLPFAYQTLQQSENCISRMDDLLNLRYGTLNIGVTYTFSPILTETVLSFTKAYPQIKLNICYKTMKELMDMLMKREVDFVLSYKPTRCYKQIESHILFDDRLSAVVPLTHPLAQYEKVALSTVLQYPLALPSKGIQARNVLDRLLTNKDITLNARIELNEVNLLLHLVESSSLITILSSATIENHPELKAIPLDIADNEMEGSFHMLKDAYKKESAKEFIRLLCETNSIKIRLRNWFN